MDNVTIIVPYRNRREHRKEFVPAMKAYLPDADIYLIEQENGKPFNQGKLINVGVLIINPYFFVAHNVDIIPTDVDYSPTHGITQLASSEIQFFDYLSGATMFSKDAFIKCGGYNNDYFHRAEDNELMFNLKRLQIPVTYRIGNFRELPHERTGVEFDLSLWRKAQQPRKVQNQLSICEYSVISRKKHKLYTKITVNI